MRKAQTRSVISALIVSVLLIFVFVLSRDSFARYVWHNHSNAELAQVLNHSDADLAIELGRYYFGGGDYNLSRAKASYQKAVDIDPSILWSHYGLARVYFVEGDFDKTLVEIDRELKENPENLRSLYVRGLVYGYREYPGDLEKAEADFQRFVEWAPLEWAGYNDLAWILLKQEKYEAVIDIVDQAFAKIPHAREDNPWLWNARGVADLNLGNKASAAFSLSTALSIVDTMSLSRWREAYPGNAPSGAEEGFSAFKRALEHNLAKAQS